MPEMILPKKIDRAPDCRCPWFSGVDCKYQCAPRVECCERCYYGGGKCNEASWRTDKGKGREWVFYLGF